MSVRCESIYSRLDMIFWKYILKNHPWRHMSRGLGWATFIYFIRRSNCLVAKQPRFHFATSRLEIKGDKKENKNRRHKENVSFDTLIIILIKVLREMSQLYYKPSQIQTKSHLTQFQLSFICMRKNYK